MVDKKTYTFHVRSFEDMANNLIEGIVEGYKQCPDSENKTFEEVAEWCGKHVILNESE